MPWPREPPSVRLIHLTVLDRPALGQNASHNSPIAAAVAVSNLPPNARAVHLRSVTSSNQHFPSTHRSSTLQRLTTNRATLKRDEMKYAATNMRNASV